jgi:hypothetical protein
MVCDSWLHGLASPLHGVFHGEQNWAVQLSFQPNDGPAVLLSTHPTDLPVVRARSYTTL